MDYCDEQLEDVTLHVGAIGSGAGQSVVLVHGSWDDHSVWLETADVLAQRHRVVAYDRRGHGLSSAPPGQGHLGQDVADLRAVVTRRGNGPVHLVGHSYGACIALRFASLYPELLASLALHEPPLFGVLARKPVTRPLFEAMSDAMARAATLIQAGEAAEGARVFAEEVVFGGQRWEEAMDEALRSIWIAHAHTWLDQSRDPERLELAPDLLKQARFPVLLTRGGRSTPAFAPGVEAICAATPGAAERVLDEAGHFPHISHPLAYAETLLEFIDNAA